MLDEPFHMPRGFSIERYLGNAWHLIPETGARPGRRRPLQPAGRPQRGRSRSGTRPSALVRRDDGTIDFHVRVSGIREISWWILGYGDQAEVLKPAKLRQLIAERAPRLVELYNGDAS